MEASGGVWISKKENSAKLRLFRTALLLSVEGTFQTVDRLPPQECLHHDTMAQKGGIPGVSGCLEHTEVVT